MRSKRSGRDSLYKDEQEPLKAAMSIVPRHDRRPTFASFLHEDEKVVALSAQEDEDFAVYTPHRFSEASSMSPLLYEADGMTSPLITPFAMSPYVKSPWIIPAQMKDQPLEQDYCDFPRNGLIGSLVRKEGHVYSLAASGELLYTGSDSKNIRVWKNFEEFSGFKSNSGLVKAIVISGDRIFTGHQDGKIRIWRRSVLQGNVHKRVGSLPTWKDRVKSSMNPKSYVKVRRHRKVLRIAHFDAVSCLSLDEEAGILYSGSWDKTMKVWRTSDSRCLESVTAHNDAVNTVLTMGKGMVLTGSADGSVRIWRRDLNVRRNTTRHVLVRVLLSQESAVTSLAVNLASDVVYCGSSDGTVNFWTVTRGREMRHGGVLRGHWMAVLCLATGGSHLVFSGSADKSVRVWRREESGSAHTCIATLTGHAGPIKCLAVVSEDDNGSAGASSSSSEEEEEGDRPNQRWRVYSGSLDRSVRVWSVAGDQHVQST
ncbi:hypothetical protein MLD38_013822 [Melastoma candidum]|uniref:Uncharacterized protein n=1 Tax=Melastoma candidum TaxID=119954 RepID=A0ACB9RC37_9MYRT|nr:hypothetical protein MLD38_013822 [Melastoma candidum]